MRRFAPLILLALASPAFSGEHLARLTPALLGGTAIASAGSPSYLFADDFENGNTQWTKSQGTANGNFAYATAPAPLAGSYSLLLDESLGNVLLYRNTTNWQAVEKTYAYAQVNIGAIGNVSTTTTRYVLVFRDASNNDICSTGLRSNGDEIRWAVTASGASALTTIVPATATTYHVWLEYVEGSGDGSCSVFVATTGTKPGSASAARTGLNLTTDAVRIGVAAFYNEVDAVIFDKVRVDNESIGSDPS